MLDDPSLFPILLAACVVAAFAIGAIVGRRTGEAQKRIDALEAQVGAITEERQLSVAAAEAAKNEAARVRGELREYRDGVVEHFTGTSGLLRELTHQYRAVYDHLTEGATSLCPKGSIDQLEALQAEKLPEIGKPFEPAEKPSPSAPEAAGKTASAKLPKAPVPPNAPPPNA